MHLTPKLLLAHLFQIQKSNLLTKSAVNGLRPVTSKTKEMVPSRCVRCQLELRLLQFMALSQETITMTAASIFCSWETRTRQKFRRADMMPLSEVIYKVMDMEILPMLNREILVLWWTRMRKRWLHWLIITDHSLSSPVSTTGN